MRVLESPFLKLYLFFGGVAGGCALGLFFLLFGWLIFGGSGDSSVSNERLAGGPTASLDDSSAAGPAALEPTIPSNPAVTREAGSPPLPSRAPAASTGAMPTPSEDIKEIEEKLRRIVLGFHNFHDTFRAFALPRFRDLDVVEPSRRPQPTQLSWRVHLLPFVQQQPLYNRFHLDEPWDSPHNKSLLEHMPDVYRIGASDDPTTRFQVITGPDMLFGNPTPPRMRDVPDGPRHTILAVVTGPDRAVLWTQPDELTLDPSAPVHSLGTLPDQLVMCGMTDGQPLILRNTIDPVDFLALATPSGGEIIDADTLRRRFNEPIQTRLSAVSANWRGPVSFLLEWTERSKPSSRMFRRSGSRRS